MTSSRAVPLDTSWTIAPAVLASVVVGLSVYGVRWRRVRAAHGGRGAGVGRLVLWVVAMALVLIALVSPLDAISEQLASAHMIQHLLLADLVPIAMILALSKLILRPLTRGIHDLERRAGWIGHPVFGVVAYVGAMWFWHVPPMYDAALRHGGVHVAEHLTFAASGSLYWWHLISPIRSRLRLGGMAPVAYMVSTKLLVGALGVALAFSPDLLYDYSATTMMPALDDQHVAGLIMGLEQSLVMGVGLAYLFARMLSEADAADRREERLEDRAVGDLGGPLDRRGPADDDVPAEADVALDRQPVRLDQ